MPSISIIIPCYNRASYICKTIESVLEQTYKDFELIVIDDGSTDNSKEMILKYSDKVVFLEHAGGINKGQSASLNLGLRHCKGEFVCILDSDDLFAPTKLEEQIAFLRERPDVGLVYSNGKSTDAEGNPRYTIYSDNHEPPIGPSEILLDCFVNLPSNSMVRKAVLEQVGPFNEQLRAAHDHDMVLRISEVTKLEFLNRIHWFYRRHGDSMSHKNASLTWSDGFTILNAACKRHPYSFVTRRKRRAVLHFRLAQCYSRSGRYLTAFGHVLKAGILDPARSMNVIFGKERITSPH